MSANAKFQFGLNVRKNVVTDESKKVANVFGDESDDEGQESAAEKFDRKYAASAATKARERRIVEKEMACNPDVFDYDVHYEQIQQQRDQKVAEQKEADKEKKPKYAHLLAKAHKQRELNRLLVEENTYKKEREKEAGHFKDEEVFVTGAYRQQIEEREQHKAEMEREEAIEKMRDVRDQKMWQQAFNRTLLENIARAPIVVMEEKEVLKGEAKAIKKEEEEGHEMEKELKMEVEEEEEHLGGKTETFEGQEREDERGPAQREQEDDGMHQKRHRMHSTTPPPPSSSSLAESGKHHRRERTDEENERSDDGRRRREEREGGRRERTDERKRARMDKEEKNDEKTPDNSRKKEEEQKQPLDEEGQRMARIRQVLAKRNNQSAVDAMRQRYLERRQTGQIRAPRIEATE